jgi:hypothetical protein
MKSLSISLFRAAVNKTFAKNNMVLVSFYFWLMQAKPFLTTKMLFATTNFDT